MSEERASGKGNSRCKGSETERMLGISEGQQEGGRCSRSRGRQGRAGKCRHPRAQEDAAFALGLMGTKVDLNRTVTGPAPGMKALFQLFSPSLRLLSRRSQSRPGLVSELTGTRRSPFKTHVSMDNASSSRGANGMTTALWKRAGSLYAARG